MFYHTNIVDHIEAGDVDKARDDMRKHIETHQDFIKWNRIDSKSNYPKKEGGNWKRELVISYKKV